MGYNVLSMVPDPSTESARAGLQQHYHCMACQCDVAAVAASPRLRTHWHWHSPVAHDASNNCSTRMSAVSAASHNVSSNESANQPDMMLSTISAGNGVVRFPQTSLGRPWERTRKGA